MNTGFLKTLAGVASAVALCFSMELNAKDANLPKTVVVDMNFGSVWPLYEEIVPKSMRSVKGDRYTYRYKYGKNKAFFDVTICRRDSTKTYYYKESSGAYKENSACALYMQGKYSWICIPAVPERRLVSVEVFSTNGVEKTVFLKDKLKGDSIDKIVLPPATGQAPSYGVFNGGGNGYMAGKRYFIVMGSANIQIYRIKLVYKK